MAGRRSTSAGRSIFGKSEGAGPEERSKSRTISALLSDNIQLPNAKKEALTVLDQAPDNSDVIRALAESARTSEDIGAAWDSSRSSLKRTTFRTTSLWQTCLLTKEMSQRQPRPSGRLSLDPNSSAATWQWETCMVIQKDQKQATEE